MKKTGILFLILLLILPVCFAQGLQDKAVTLPAPENLYWDGQVAHWSAVSGAESYVVELVDADTERPVAYEQDITGTSSDFTAALDKKESVSRCYFVVYAQNDSGVSKSAYSDILTVKRNKVKKVVIAGESYVCVDDEDGIVLSAVTTPSSFEEVSYTWSVKSGSSAALDAVDGDPYSIRVRPLKLGKTKIICTVKTQSNKKSSKAFEITVYDPSLPISVELSGISENMLYVGGSETLTAEVFPATSKEYCDITWKSTNEKILTVDASGKVTAHKVGTATVKCIAQSGSAKAVGSRKITVLDPTKLSAVRVIDNATGEKVDSVVSMTVGDAASTFTGQPLPDTGKVSGVTYTAKVSGKTVADAVFSGNTLTVTPKGDGTAKITVTAKQGKTKRTASFTVVVTDPYKPATVKVLLPEGRSSTLRIGETLQLTPNIQPEDHRATLRWKSSKASVASIDENGLVTAVKKGKATISLTAVYGDYTKTAKLKITVVP